MKPEKDNFRADGGDGMKTLGNVHPLTPSLPSPNTNIESPGWSIHVLPTPMRPFAYLTCSNPSLLAISCLSQAAILRIARKTSGEVRISLLDLEEMRGKTMLKMEVARPCKASEIPGFCRYALSASISWNEPHRVGLARKGKMKITASAWISSGTCDT